MAIKWFRTQVCWFEASALNPGADTCLLQAGHTYSFKAFCLLYELTAIHSPSPHLPSRRQERGRKNASPISHSGPAALTEAPKFSPCTGASGHLSSSEWSHKLDTRDSWGLWQFRVFSLVTPHISQDVVLCHSGSQHLLQTCSLSDFSPLRSGVIQKKESDCVPTWSLSCSPSDLTPGVGLLIYKTGWG